MNILISILISVPFIVGSSFIPNTVVEYLVFGVGLFLSLILGMMISDKIISKKIEKETNS